MKIRLIIWLTISLVGSIILFSEMWLKLLQWLSPDGLQRYGVFHWGVLGLCILWLWLKRKDITSRMQTARFSLPFILGGLVLLALSIFLPRSDNFLVFLVILGWLGIFTIMLSGIHYTNYSPGDIWLQPDVSHIGDTMAGRVVSSTGY